MNGGLIEFKGVSKSFGKNRVLNKINFHVPDGKITCIIGASGEGKSTILKLITYFYKPDSGKIYYAKREVKKDMKNIQRSFGLSIEEGSFYENLTVEENLFHFGGLYGVKRKILKRRVEGLTKFVGLNSAKGVYAKNLSLGMKKRLDLACALVHKPAVLVLDEPTADLDPLLRSQMMGLIKKINSHGTTVIFTTQLLGEVENNCDNLAILYDEHIIDEGEIPMIKKKYGESTMEGVFKKIFSKKGRRTYQESVKEKTKIGFVKKKDFDEHQLIAGEDSSGKGEEK